MADSWTSALLGKDVYESGTLRSPRVKGLNFVGAAVVVDTINGWATVTVGAGTDGTAIHDNVAGEIAAVAVKVTPVSSDLILIEDSADSNNKKRITIGSLPAGGSDNAAIHDNIAGEIALITLKATPVSGDLLVIEDSADSNNKKRVTVGSLPGGSGTDANAIHDNVAAEISAITAKATPTTSDFLLIEDAADANNKKRITVGDLPAAAPAAHAPTHETGGSDALDGGNIAYAASPTNYTEGSATTGGHFSGIDTALGLTSLTDGSRAFTNPVSGVTPTADAHLTTKAYVDALAQGLDVKPSVRAVATANQATLSGTAQTIDGFALNAVGMRVLLTAQSTATQNGIWVVQSGAWTRPTDFDTGDQAAGAFTFVESGTANADSGWVCTSNTGADVIDTDNLAWTQFSGAGQITAGTGLTKTGNTINAIGSASITANADSLVVNPAGVDHGSLAGTGDDDHTIYSLVSGARAFTGNVGGITPTAAAHLTRKDYVDTNPTQQLITASTTTTDGDAASATALSFNPRGGRLPDVTVVGGINATVGDGVKTTDCYFSGNSGSTARADGAVVSGDTLHWNESVAGFNLAAGEPIKIKAIPA